jgi:glutamate racemase
MDNSQLPVGIFDSGVGGLTVLHAIRDLLPAEQLIYLGDTARVPYGTKSPVSVQRYAAHAADFLRGEGVKLLVVACNTASALALDNLRKRLAPIPVIGVVEPGAAVAVSHSRNKRHLVLATEATTSQLAYTRAILRHDPDALVEELPCSLFVALAEEGWNTGSIAQAVADEYLAGINQRDAASRPDTAILGCTHFPLLREPIAAALGAGIEIVDSATTTARAVQRELQAKGLAAPAGVSGGMRLIATDGAARFARVGGAFLGRRFSEADIEVVDIHPSDTLD